MDILESAVRSTIARAVFLLVLTLSIAGPGQAQDVADWIGIPGPISFRDQTYGLAWSARPAPGYSKHEYVPAGQAPETYRDMILIDLIESGTDVQESLNSQMKMLDERRATDPMVNMAAVRNDETGEAILDFILSGRTDQGVAILEWNAYRYAPYAGPDGRAGVMLFAVSRRTYGEEGVTPFLRELKLQRQVLIQELARLALPKPQPVP